MSKLPLMICASLLAFATPTMALDRFDSNDLNSRIDQLQKQVAQLQQGGAGSAPGTAQMTSEIARIDEELRLVHGEIEKLQFGQEQQTKQFTSFQKDLEFRLQALEGHGAAGNGAAPITKGSPDDTATPAYEPPSSLPENSGANYDPAKDTYKGAGDKLAPPGQKGTTPRDLYNNAFRQLNGEDYTGAEQGFSQFTSQYPHDPLVGNAYYWLGETYYKRQNFPKAADTFRKGFEAMPSGPKAGDNLLKLAMTLSALKRDTEACVVYKQVDLKYGANSDNLRTRARQEIQKLHCQ